MSQQTVIRPNIFECWFRERRFLRLHLHHTFFRHVSWQCNAYFLKRDHNSITLFPHYTRNFSGVTSLTFLTLAPALHLFISSCFLSVEKKRKRREDLRSLKEKLAHTSTQRAGWKTYNGTYSHYSRRFPYWMTEPARREREQRCSVI